MIVNRAPPSARFSARTLAAVQLDQVLDDRQARGPCRRDRARATCPRGRSARTRATRSSSGMPGPSSDTAIATRRRRRARLDADRRCAPARRCWRWRPDCAARRAAWPDRRARVSAPGRDGDLDALVPLARARARGRRRPPATSARVSQATTSSVSWPASSRASRSRSLTSRSMRSRVARDDRRGTAGSPRRRRRPRTAPRRSRESPSAACAARATRWRRSRGGSDRRAAGR